MIVSCCLKRSRVAAGLRWSRHDKGISSEKEVVGGDEEGVSKHLIALLAFCRHNADAAKSSSPRPHAL